MKSWKLIFISVAVVIAASLMVVFAVQGIQNKAINFEEQITTAQSEIKIQEKRRADLIPNLVDCVKAYDKHEYETLMNVIKARGTSSDAAIDEITTMINAVAEAYPQLQSNTNYQQLMTELSVTENLIAQTRSNYNTWVTKYKSYVRKFPNKGILEMLGYEVQEFEKLTFDTSSNAPTNLFD
jgi:LemA protein